MSKLFFHLLTHLLMHQTKSSTNCLLITDQTECESTDSCSWDASASFQCTCTTTQDLDIIFGVDKSGSIGETDFKKIISWLETYVDTAANIDSTRYGFIEFSAKTYITDLQSYSSKTALRSFVSDIEYIGSTTNTGQMLDDSITQYTKYGDDTRERIIIILTDGVPYLSGIGHHEVCGESSLSYVSVREDYLKNTLNVRVIVIAIGSEREKASEYLTCFVKSEDDIYLAETYDEDDFLALIPDVVSVTCPINYEILITEIKPVMDTKSTQTSARFVELYNDGSVEIPLSLLNVAGMVNSLNGLSFSSYENLAVNAYLVLYDNEEEYVSCQECNDNYCSKYTANPLIYTSIASDAKWCENQIYIPCCSDSSICPCEFADQSSVKTDDFNLEVYADSGTDTTDLLDSIIYDSSNGWSVAVDGYSWELQSLGHNNQEGANWFQSCNELGTPGSLPVDDCVDICSTDTCQLNGATSSTCDDTYTCDCENGYYASGVTCRKIPEASDCVITIGKAFYNRSVSGITWTFTLAQTDAVVVSYRLFYYSNDDPDNPFRYITTYSSIYFDAELVDFDFATIGSMVNGTSSLNEIQCTVVTTSPTLSPTRPPSKSPTRRPTMLPSQSPTYSMQYMYFDSHGCSVDNCECHEADLSTCCIGEQYLDENADCDDADEYRELHQTTYAHTVKFKSSEAQFNSSIGWNITWMRDELVPMEESGESLQFNSSTNTNSTWLASVKISPMSGVDSINDVENRQGSISIMVTDAVYATLDDYSNDYDIYSYYRIEIQNCSISGYEVGVDLVSGCGVAYPYYYYVKLHYAQRDSYFTEEEIPAWVVPVVVALGIFCCCLVAVLVIVWWVGALKKNAIREQAGEIDDANRLAENALEDDLATGEIKQNPIFAGVPNAQAGLDPVGAGIDANKALNKGEFAEVAVEKFDCKEEVAGNYLKRKTSNKMLSERLL